MMPLRLPSASLRLRTLALVVVLLGFVHLVYGAKLVAGNRALLFEEARAHLELMTETSARALSAPLWDFDTAQVENALAAFEADPFIVGGWLNGPDGARIARFGRTRGLPPWPLMTARHPVVVRLGEHSETLGTLTVQLSTERVGRAVARQRRQTVLSSAVVLLTLCGSLLAIARALTEPLAQIRRAIADVQAGRLDRAVPATERQDEIGEIARAIEGFRLSLIETADLRAVNDRLAGEERLRIRSALESTEDAAVILDERGCAIFVNPAAVALAPALRLGIEPDLSGVLPSEELRALAHAIRDRCPLSAEADVLGPDGQTRRMDIRLNPIRDREGNFFGTVALAADVSERERAERRIHHLANHDSLTDLPNRRVFEREVRERLSEGGCDQTAIFLLDLDRFKAINDMMGHPVGDRLLVRIGEILRAMMRSGDLVARLGGDEFAILISGRDLEARADRLASGVVERLSRPIDVAGRTLHTGASVGYLIARCGECTGGEALRRADLALYEAKRRGRGCYVLFEEKMTTRLVRRSEIERALRDALSRGRINLAFQAQYSLPDMALAGFEALARWQHPTLGEVGPSEFIPIVEESGLVVELSETTLHQVCEAAAAWRARGFPGRVSVNISPALFRDDVTAILGRALADSGCPAEALEVEITETVLLADNAANRSQIAEIREAGVHIAIDDFGMGYSSLGYLRRFPVDRIKIDRTFVAELGRCPQAAAIVTAIAELGHALGMAVTAEGVERPEQLDALIAAECDRAQGYLLGRPGPRAAADEAVVDAVLTGADAAAAAVRQSERRA